MPTVDFTKFARHGTSGSVVYVVDESDTCYAVGMSTMVHGAEGSQWSPIFDLAKLWPVLEGAVGAELSFGFSA